MQGTQATALAATAAGAGTTSPTNAPLRLSEVSPPSSRPDVLQVHMTVPDPLARAILDKNGAEMSETAAAVQCQAWMTSAEVGGDRRIVIIGNYNQCLKVQQVVHRQIADVLRAEGQEPWGEAKAVLLVRAEAAGVVIGKQGFVLKQIGNQSGAKVQLLREELQGQRPCIITGELSSVLRAEKHVFDLVRAVPIGGPNLPRWRIGASNFPIAGQVVSWKGHVGWIQPEQAIDHPKAAAHQGHIYIHDKDVINGGPLTRGQQVRFYVYLDQTGLGAEECTAI